jgi:uncharacterized protein YbaA (DUF1428 family)
MEYVDGYVIAVPTKNKDIYREFALIMTKVFKEHGATRIVECWGDDVPEGKVTSFPMAVKCKEDETVVFSWIMWPSKEVRTVGWEKAMADERMQPHNMEMPFDGQRIIFGGFNVFINE